MKLRGGGCRGPRRRRGTVTCGIVVDGEDLRANAVASTAEPCRLMYSHTEPPPDERLPWHRRPSIVGVLGLAGTFALNLVFF